MSVIGTIALLIGLSMFIAGFHRWWKAHRELRKAALAKQVEKSHIL